MELFGKEGRPGKIGKEEIKTGQEASSQSPIFKKLYTFLGLPG